jgi:hypothetical protein
MTDSLSLMQLRAGIARAEHQSKRTGDTSSVVEARREYYAAKIAEYVKKTADSAPPLTDEQRDMITALLRSPEVT